MLQRFENQGQKIRGQRRYRTKFERTYHRIACGARNSFDLRSLGKGSSGMLQNLASGRGEGHAFVGAFQQGHPEFIFEFFDLAAERGLTYMARFGSAAEVALL